MRFDILFIVSAVGCAAFFALAGRGGEKKKITLFLLLAAIICLGVTLFSGVVVIKEMSILHSSLSSPF
jgi:hypothetical protein